MSVPEEPNVWNLLVEQLPAALRWVLGILSLGFFTLASWIWKRQEQAVRRIEDQLHARMDREMRDVHDRLNEIDKHLLEVVQNTRRDK